MKITKIFIDFFIQQFTDFFFPPHCPGCEKFVAKNGDMCPKCWKELPFILEPLCEVYGTPLDYAIKDLAFDKTDIINPYNLSNEAVYDPPPFKRARAAFVHQKLAQKFISQYKYNDQLHLTPFLASFMMSAGKDLIKDCDIIIPMPLHFWRFFHRHYNQASELARFIAKKTGKAYWPNSLKRIRNTKQQARLNAFERRNNVKDAFFVRENYKEKLKGKRILLIDDVYTTGATAKSATNALKAAQTFSVDILTFSRALRSPAVKISSNLQKNIIEDFFVD